MHRIVIQLDAGANFHIRICCPQPLDLIKVDAGVITIVIGERDLTQPFRARTIDPRLEQFTRVRLHAMPLRMRVVIGEKHSLG